MAIRATPNKRLTDLCRHKIVVFKPGSRIKKSGRGIQVSRQPQINILKNQGNSIANTDLKK